MRNKILISLLTLLLLGVLVKAASDLSEPKDDMKCNMITGDSELCSDFLATK